MVMHISPARRERKTMCRHRDVRHCTCTTTFFALKAKDFRLDLAVDCCCWRVEIFSVNWDLVGSIGFKRLPLVMIDEDDDDEEEITCSSLLIGLAA